MRDVLFPRTKVLVIIDADSYDEMDKAIAEHVEVEEYVEEMKSAMRRKTEELHTSQVLTKADLESAYKSMMAAPLKGEMLFLSTPRCTNPNPILDIYGDRRRSWRTEVLGEFWEADASQVQHQDVRVWSSFREGAGSERHHRLEGMAERSSSRRGGEAVLHEHVREGTRREVR